MSLECIDRRVLGAVRCLDATTGSLLSNPMLVKAKGINFGRNRSGYYVILGAPGYPSLQAHTSVFQQPLATPALGSVTVELQVSDPSGQYLPRLYNLPLPRDPLPQNADRSNSLFQPADILLYPTPIAHTASGWAVIRATVREDGIKPQRLPWSLIRVVPNSSSVVSDEPLSDSIDLDETNNKLHITLDGTSRELSLPSGSRSRELVVNEINNAINQAFGGGVQLNYAELTETNQLAISTDSSAQFSSIRVRANSALGFLTDVPLAIARGMADWRGEALVAVPGIPVTTWETGETEDASPMKNEISVTLDIVFDPVLKKISDQADLSILSNPNKGYIPNPDVLETRWHDLHDLPSDSISYQLASGLDRADILSVTFN